MSVTRLDGVLDSLGDFSGSACQCCSGIVAAMDRLTEIATTGAKEGKGRKVRYDRMRNTDRSKREVIGQWLQKESE